MHSTMPSPPRQRVLPVGMAERTVFIIHTNVSKEMQQEAVEYATHALDEYNNESDMAAYISAKFNGRFSPGWNCIVGRHFGAQTFHCFYIHFKIGQVTIFLSKSR